ncbi:hypothetical protein [Microcoleus sp. FACHB-1515]|uniref:hypothetical protein n=1 Tax=Cyanophyceae TaxID=3028117 RepID=UPI0016842E43|nr:hypothetical protein [Microcoleus sp. FACHB-1515]
MACLAAAIVLLLGAIAPAVAQFGSRSIDVQQVYVQLPDLPLENQYVSRETGEVAQHNTLVSRMVQYHLLVANRIPTSRLDWKLTMADYLGANEWMRPGLYPGADTFRANPIEGDRAAIEQLNRAQRDALIDVLVGLFSASADAPNVPPRQVPAEPNAAQQLPR